MLLSVSTFAFVRGWTARIERMAPGERVDVWVAAHDLAAGASIAQDDLRAESVPSEWVPDASASSDDLLGRRVVGPVGAGEILTTARVSSAAGPVASMVPEGLRAVVLPSRLPPGVVAAGDRVDVMATFTGGQPYTDTVGESLEVLRVLPAGSDPTDGIGLVLLADPTGAERLAHARTFAELSVSVVGGGGGARDPATETGVDG